MMNRSTRLASLGVVALVVACGDRSPTDAPPLKPEVAAPTYGIELVSVSSSESNGGGSIFDMTAPAVNVGDVLIAQVVVAKLNGPSTASPDVICAPAGWSSIRRTNNRADHEESDISQETFVFVAAAAAPAASYQWSIRSGTCNGSGADRFASGAISRFSGVNATQPIDVDAGSVGAGTPPLETPNVTTTVNGAHVLRFVGVSTSIQVWFNGVSTAYSVGASAGEPRTAAAGDFSQGIAGPTDAGSFRFSPEGEHDWVGQTVALRPLHELSILIRDSYSRVGVGWGEADVGGVWLVNESGPAFQVDGNRGIVEAKGDGSVYIAVARVASTYGLNVAGLTSFSVDRMPEEGSYHTIQVYARRNDRETNGDYYYRYRVHLFGAKPMEVGIEKNVAGVRSFVKGMVTLTTTFSPGVKYWMRWEATGTSPATTVRMRVWQDGEAEPRSWHAATVVDEQRLDYAGTSGYRIQARSGELTLPVRIYVDDFLYEQR
jgi:hypothetical protein